MLKIYESEHFIIEARNPPHITRSDGGHIVISPKIPLKDRTEMTVEQAKEFVKLSMVTGEAFAYAMAQQGIELGRINYQDNGNFNTTLHLHLYGRAIHAKIQTFGTTLQFPSSKEEFIKYIQDLEPLHEEDLDLIRNEIERLLQTHKYKNF